MLPHTCGLGERKCIATQGTDLTTCFFHLSEIFINSYNLEEDDTLGLTELVSQCFNSSEKHTPLEQGQYLTSVTQTIEAWAEPESLLSSHFNRFVH